LPIGHPDGLEITSSTQPVGLDRWIAHFSFYTLRNLPQLTITHSQIIRFPSPFPSFKQPPQINLPSNSPKAIDEQSNTTKGEKRKMEEIAHRNRNSSALSLICNE
jgi:hypothetical protein